MNKLLHNATVFVLELLLQVFSNLLPESIRFQHPIPKTNEFGEECKAFVVVNFIITLTKPNKHPSRAGP